MYGVLYPQCCRGRRQKTYFHVICRIYCSDGFLFFFSPPLSPGISARSYVICQLPLPIVSCGFNDLFVFYRFLRIKEITSENPLKRIGTFLSWLSWFYLFTCLFIYHYYFK
ncbi:hypothetical protein I7I48_04100 [Histoplasma ohiense]|nr:hypothetical protein I7I48_04100 [Histoplasma ohiense (nom. inval.)]